MFAGGVEKLQLEKMKPQEQITLEPYERDHAVVVGVYRWVAISSFVHIRILLLAVFLFTCSLVKKENYCIITTVLAICTFKHTIICLNTLQYIVVIIFTYIVIRFSDNT